MEDAMLIERWEPFREMAELRNDVNRLFTGSPLFRHATEVEDSAPAERPWLPAVDVYETPSHVGLRVEVPGLDKKDIEVHVEDGVLSVKGEKKFEHQDKGKNWRRVETRYGAFHRSFVLPDTVDAEKIEAGYNQGVLTISMPRKEESLPRKLDIKVG